VKGYFYEKEDSATRAIHLYGRWAGVAPATKHGVAEIRGVLDRVSLFHGSWRNPDCALQIIRGAMHRKKVVIPKDQSKSDGSSTMTVEAN
jgi:hypothetical protein